MYDIIIFHKLLVDFCINDTKLCYYQIIHLVAIMEMEILGIPEGQEIFMFSSIQQLHNHTCDAFGDSTDYIEKS